jgi:hypothetical protein
MTSHLPKQTANGSVLLSHSFIISSVAADRQPHERLLPGLGAVHVTDVPKQDRQALSSIRRGGVVTGMYGEDIFYLTKIPFRMERFIQSEPRRLWFGL